MRFARNSLSVLIAACVVSGAAVAQTVAPASQPPAPAPSVFAIPAKKLFGAQLAPAQMPSEVYGSYAKGCMAGGTALPMAGPSWQIMRPSRNRNWGMPQLVNFLERVSAEARAKAGWPGLLVGDMAQPRGGPMKTGHASHQVGLDADIWFTPMPNYVMTAKERETKVPLNMTKSYAELVPGNWSDARSQLVQIVASKPEVARIFVHPPIKAELCRWSGGKGAWLAKVRPYFGHTYHFHVRLRCPAGMKACKNQAEPAPVDGTGCGPELAKWQSYAFWHPKPRPPGPKPSPKPPLTLSGLPAQCRAVIAAP